MGESLRISVIVDGSQVTAGMSGVATTVEAATAKIKAAFGSVQDAPEGIRNALTVLQNSARMSADSVAAATAAIGELGGVAASAAPEVEAVGVAASGTATQMSSMERAMAMATGRMAGFASGMGFSGAAMARVASTSTTLAPILAAAFPVIGALVLIDVIGNLLDKMDELAEQPYKVKIAFDEMSLGVDKALEGAQDQLDRLHAKFLDLTQGPVAGMRFELGLIAQNFSNVESAANSAFSGIQKGLKEADMSRMNPVGWLAWLKGVDVGVKDLKPLADQINASLQEALLAKDPAKIQQALMSGITELARVQQKTETDAYLAEADHDSVLTERYNQRILAIKAMIDALEKLKIIETDDQKKTNAETDVKRAEIAKEIATQTRQASDAGAAYAKAVERSKEQAQGLADKVKQLADAEAEFASKAAGTESKDDLSDLEARASAEQQFRQDRLNDERQEALSEIEVEQDKVKERASLGQISAATEAQQLNDLEQKKLQIETAYLQQRMTTILARLTSDDAQTYAEDVKEWSKLLSQKQAAEDAYNKNRQKNVDTAALQEQKTWTKMTQGINQLFNFAIQGIVTGTERFSTAFGRMVDGMLAKFIEAMLQMVEQWIETHVLMLAVKKSAQQEEVLSDAKAAAAAAWKAVAGIPIIGPALAPIAAATAFAGVEALSAEGGMVVPADNTLSLLHANEMVLPANISAGLSNLIGSGGGGSGVSIQMGDVHAIDAKGVQDVLSKQSAHLAKLVRKELRRTNAI